MAFNANVPLANDRLSTSQADLNDNFQEINTYVNVDHVAFNVADQGKHKRVFFQQQAADPATGATEAALYTKDSVAVPGTASLYYRPPNSAAPVEFTYALNAASGWTWLPSGIMMQWTSGGFAGANQVFALPRAFPTAHLMCQVSSEAYTGGNERDWIVGGTPNGLAAVTVGRHPGWAGTAFTVYILSIGY